MAISSRSPPASIPAGASAILTIDADLQDPPELLGDMWRLMDSAEADVVYGVRRQREGETMLKRGTAALFYRLMQRIGYADLPVDAGDFRLMTRRVLDILNSMPEQHRFIRGMVAGSGFAKCRCPMTAGRGTDGRQQLSARQDDGACLRRAHVVLDHAAAPCLLYRPGARPFELADARLHARQLGARACGRRLDELAHRGSDSSARRSSFCSACSANMSAGFIWKPSAGRCSSSIGCQPRRLRL